jgi:hypothetical protein
VTKGTRVRHTVRLPPDLSRQLAEFAARKRVSQAALVEAALVSFLSPDGPERLEAAFARRLDRISRRLDKLDYHVEVGNEAFTLYLRSWLTSTLPPEEGFSAAARASAELRFCHFIEALARRMESGRHLADDLVRATEKGGATTRE